MLGEEIFVGGVEVSGIWRRQQESLGIRLEDDNNTYKILEICFRCRRVEKESDCGGEV